MLLLKLISPKNLPRKKSEWKFYHKCYKALLCLLFKRYALGVIDDIVILNDVEVRHTLRDGWFESELSRLGVVFVPSVKTTSRLSFEKRRYRHSWLFSWEEKLMVACSSQYCTIVRDHSIALESNINASVQTSNDINDILAIWIKEVKTSKKPVREGHGGSTQQNEIPAVQTTKTEPPQKKRKIHIKDIVRPQDVSTGQTPQTEQPKEKPTDNFIQHQGFEENEIF